MGLKGKTPAKAAGIKIEGENPWVTVIQKEAKSRETQVVDTDMRSMFEKPSIARYMIGD